MLVRPTPDQEFLRETTARFLADKVPPSTIRALRADDDGFTPEYWRQGVELGWTHLLVSEDLGGGSASGAGIVDLSLIAHEFGRCAAPGPLLVNAVVAGALSEARGHDDVVKRLLTGEDLATWAFLDGPRRDEASSQRLRITPDGDSLVLDGTKRPVESASRSDHLLVTGTSPDGPTQVLVPAGTPGVSTARMHSVDLTRRFDVVTFDGVRVGADAVVGTVGGAAEAVERQLRWALVVSCAEAVGAMQTAFDMTLAWTSDRYSFGRPLGSYQAIKHRMAHMKTWLEAGHAITDDAAAAVAVDAPDAGKLASAAAAYVGEQGSELMQECVQLHGGIGVTFEHDLHLYLRRQTLDRALYGTPSEHRRRVAAFLDREVEAELGSGAA
ncbi:acyl-CoA dehydrogenase family protein [Dermatobacter hominis]|uniref:acyl-CoA dehydrogenase family protein n=1 Tax=Dermatobacter hominis TaxID=2884263 RepID=UPI001D12F754|nr:acyl-CoA dehydrogenase family protein [Dermatobacter hominis]UDY36634.1 acyl-CoA dehydrogenase family protein [Dermatobacter hominis]